MLYYRIQRSAEADAQLATLHKAFVEITLRLSGTFYLPYRHHYSEAEMDEAYPNAKHFFERKQHYDPTCMFSSTWFERYGRRFWVGTEEPAASATPEASAPPEAQGDHSDGPFDVQVPEVSTHRSDSYIKLMNDRKMRADFRWMHAVDKDWSRRWSEVMFDYAFPTDGSQNAVWTTVSLCVEIPYLLGLLRFCTKHGIAVKQIYDWWC
eukprot:COSAG02_NODE_1479_length_12402_cov_5.937576_5_plen_208_part_00